MAGRQAKGQIQSAEIKVGAVKIHGGRARKKPFTLFIEGQEEHKYVLPTYKVNGLW